jgi:hypothetical protein
MTKRLLATLKQEHPSDPRETTNSHEWWFSDDAEFHLHEGFILVFDNDNPGNLMSPNFLVVPMRNYDEVKVVEKE